MPKVPEDENRIDTLHDIFGREKHRMDRPDMGGVGSFLTLNKSMLLNALDPKNRRERASCLFLSLFF